MRYKYILSVQYVHMLYEYVLLVCSHAQMRYSISCLSNMSMWLYKYIMLVCSHAQMRYKYTNLD